VRAAVADDRVQADIAADVLRRAEIVAVPLPVLCEFVWVLLRGYGRNAGEIAAAIRHLATSANVSLDQPAVDAGLAMLDRRRNAAVIGGITILESRPATAR
jgi:predicted nucleic-acid-binding protein